MRLIILLVLLRDIQARQMLESAYVKWSLFKSRYQKHYTNEIEESFRFKIFVDNLNKIDNHNENYENGMSTYTLAVSMWSDLLEHEYLEEVKCVTIVTRHPKSSDKMFVPPSKTVLHPHVDWRDEGAVTSVQAQGHCRSCWAFSTVGAIEGQHFLKIGTLEQLSAQHLVDCDILDSGCKIGQQLFAYKYLQDYEGIVSEKSYPYLGSEGVCDIELESVAANVTDYREIENGNERDLKCAVATVGPIAASIDGTGMQHYSGGIFNNPWCSSTEVNLGVLVVGYGTTDEGLDYWIVKNSWGENWGDKGYILMSRNKRNQCGIASFATFPIL